MATPFQNKIIPAIQPKDDHGHQFVVYADSCSGVPGGRHEATFAAVNAIVQRLHPAPDFICFPGDEIQGLTGDEIKLREQWRYWLEHEMAWLNQQAIPLYHTTGNHTTYDAMSESVFADVLSKLPRNGPPEQVGLSYYVRRKNLLMVFVHTLWSGLGGEGRVETSWLDTILVEHHDADYKFVFGHHPVFSVNGLSGAFQREINPDDGHALWDVLVRHGVLAYWCSHILAFDVQVHEGVLQILTAGAGTAHRMPPETEYLHCVQAAVDVDGLQYQVLDTNGQVREALDWPLPRPNWQAYQDGDEIKPDAILMWKITGYRSTAPTGQPQTLCCLATEASRSAIWVGLTGPEQRLTVYLTHTPERSPHHWYGPPISHQQPFEIQVAFHRGMGPGGIMWRWDEAHSWSSLSAASPWGVERIAWDGPWCIGQRQDKTQPFTGTAFVVSVFSC